MSMFEHFYLTFILTSLPSAVFRFIVELTASVRLKLLARAYLSTTLKFEKKSVKYRAVLRL